MTRDRPPALRVEDGRRWVSPERGRITTAVFELGRTSNFLILTRDAQEEVYAQAYHRVGAPWYVEHRAGSASQHFTVTLPGAASVVAALVSWL